MRSSISLTSLPAAKYHHRVRSHARHFCLILFLLPLHLPAQVAELGRKFDLPDSLLPSDDEWKNFLKENMHSDDRLSVSNADSSKVYTVIVQRNSKPARAFVQENFMADAEHEIQQQLNSRDTVAFIAFPWFSLEENGRIYRACPPSSTAILKAPDLNTAIKYFAFLDLVTRKYFVRQEELWSLHEFTGKTTGRDLALEGRAPIVTASYLRDWQKSQRSSVALAGQAIPKLKSIAPKTYVQVDARSGVQVANNDDFTKSLIPVAYMNSEGVAFLAFLFVMETDKNKLIYLWNNKTPIEHVGRVQDQLVELLSSFPSSQWSAGDPSERRKFIFNRDFWANEVEAKSAGGNYKYLTLIGEGK